MGFRGCQVSFAASWVGAWVSGVVPVVLEHQGPRQDVMGSWVGWGGPRCVVRNATMASLHFAEIYSHFWGPSWSPPVCLGLGSCAPLQLQSQILAWEGFGGSATPAWVQPMSAAVNVPVTAGQLCLWPPGTEPPWGLPSSPPSHKGHLGQRED